MSCMYIFSKSVRQMVLLIIKVPLIKKGYMMMLTTLIYDLSFLEVLGVENFSSTKGITD